MSAAVMKTLLVFALGLVSMTLHGCGGNPTPAPTPVSPTPAPPPPPTPPTPAPPPPPPPPPGPFCADVACCKKNAKDGKDQLCDDFYNTDNGIAFTMLNITTWLLKHGGFPGLDMDNAVFNQEPPTEFLKLAQQAMSLSHYQKGMEPYIGYQNNYGVAFPMGPPSTFWKYFQRSTNTGNLCGQCTDTQADCDPTRRKPLGDMTLDDFQKAKNAVIAKTGTPSCAPQLTPWQYNEFDTNGMSAKDVAGVFYCVDGAISHHALQLSDAQMCAFLHNRTQMTKDWPLYMYQFTHKSTSSLFLYRYLECGATPAEIV